MLANIYSILAYDVPCTYDAYLPKPNSGSMLCHRRSPLLVQCRSIVYDAGPTRIHHWVCCILCANTWHSPNAVSMLTHSFRRWPDSKTALGDCAVFSDCCMGVTMRVTLSIPARNTRLRDTLAQC